nr:MAG: hypothetical protein [Bacteriophage sp.]
MLLNILMFVGIVYLTIQAIKDVKEILKNDNSEFKD